MPRAIPRPARRRARTWLTAITVASALALGACGDDERRLAGVLREPALDVATVTMPAAADGQDVPMRAEPGGLLVVSFGYTFCPDICPTTLSDLSIAVDDLPDEFADRVQVAFATVDPERDTPEVVQGYLGSFFPDGIALRTEDETVLAAAAGAFGVQYEMADHEPGERHYEVAHTAVTYVVDDTGRVVVEWPFGMTPDDMAADLTTLLEKET